MLAARNYMDASRRIGLLAVVLAVCAPVRLSTQAPVQAHPAVPTAEEKRKALDADVERLVQLARQLKTEIEHSRRDELSVRVLRDADEIDRLARSTRTRLQ